MAILQKVRHVRGCSSNIISADTFTVPMNSVEFGKFLRNYLETRLKSSLDYFVIESKMSPGAEGDMDMTGSYRKKAGDKNVFLTVIVNVLSRTIQNLQEHS